MPAPKKPARKPAAKKTATPAKKPGARKTPARRAPRKPAAPPKPPEPTTVRGAVEADLAKIAESAPLVARSAHAFTALAMADEIDSQLNSATSKSMCASRLLDAMDRLRELTPPAEKKDELHELRTRRATRRAGSTTA